MHHADAVIAGAGPAGSTAAFVLARRGFSVLLLDRESFPRKKLCGGLLTWKSLRLLERLHGCTAETLVTGGLVDTVADAFSLYHQGRSVAQGRLPYPFHLVRRDVFDAFLLDRARRAGAKIMEGCEASHCSPDGLLRTSRGAFRGRFVLGADGVNSTVRQCFALPREPWLKNLAPAIEIAVPHGSLPRTAAHPELHAGILSTGYGWVFPNREHTVLGICGLRRNNENFRTAFAGFLKTLGVSDPQAFIAAHPLQGHPIPYGNALSDPVRGNVLLAGDAGGYADPLLGEGIFYALLTGFYAGETLADALEKGVHPGPTYRERIRRHVMPEMRGANRLRWTLYALEKLGPRNMGHTFRLGGGILAEMVHGLRSYDWARKKTWDF